MKTRRGFVYIATGEGYVAEAVQSAARLKEVMPGETVCLITDVPPKNGSPFDLVIETADCVRGPIDKLLATQAPFEEVMFLDSDTYAVSDFSDAFDILQGFDMALLQEVKRGWHYELPGVPRVFAEFNTGVIVFRNSPEVREFFAEWRRQYEALRDKIPVPNANQPSFRKALFHSSLRVAPLPSEYHFLSDTPNYVMWDAKLIHGRRGGVEVDRMVNRLMGGRAYVPYLGVIGPYLGKMALLKTAAGLLRSIAKCLVSPPADISQRAPLKWWPDTPAR